MILEDLAGEDKQVDITFTPSIKAFREGSNSKKVSSLMFDKNGNFKFIFNMALKLKLLEGDQWKEVRKIYLTVNAGGQAKMEQGLIPENQSRVVKYLKCSWKK